MIFGNLKRAFIKFLIYCGISIWKLLARFGKLNVIKDGLIYPRKQVLNTPKADFQESVGKALISRLKRNLNQNGDFEYLINGYYSLEGTTKSCGQKSIKLSEVIENAEAFGSALYNAGLRKGDVVHFLIPTCTNYHYLAFGVWICNGICSLGDPGLSVSVLKTQLIETNAKFVICYEGSRNTIEKVLEDLDQKVQVVVIESKNDQDQPIPESWTYFNDFIKNTSKTDFEVDPFEDDDTAVIFWSSGTTGQPKGIQHSINTFKYVIGSIEERRPIHNLVGLTTTCFFHIGGFFFPFSIIHEKHCRIFNHGPDLENADTNEILFRQIDKFKPSYLMFGSHHLVSLSKAKPKDKSLDLSSPLIVSPMGSTVPKSLLKDLKENLTSLQVITHMYSMTEIPTLLALTLDADYGLGMLGPTVVGKVVDPDTGKICGQNEVGELMIKSKVAMKGYLNRPDENAKFFAEDGFLHTGDLVSYNNLGNLEYEGRLKDLIKYKNHHMYPLEIENVIFKHPDVVDVGVFGRPEPTVQELVTALVVKKAGSELTENDIKHLVANTLEDSKHIRGGVLFVDQLPKNPVGKTLRRNLYQVYQQLK